MPSLASNDGCSKGVNLEVEEGLPIFTQVRLGSSRHGHFAVAEALGAVVAEFGNLDAEGGFEPSATRRRWQRTLNGS